MDALDRLLAPTDRFADRHLGPSPEDAQAMLDALGFESLDALADAIVPVGIRLGDAAGPARRPLLSSMMLALTRIPSAAENEAFRSFIGLGYHGTLKHRALFIQRNLFEIRAGTRGTGLRAEIAQGRLEMLLNFQTVVSDLTGLPVANASLLDEGTAAAEAMQMLFNAQRKPTRTRFFVPSAATRRPSPSCRCAPSRSASGGSGRPELHARGRPGGRPRAVPGHRRRRA